MENEKENIGRRGGKNNRKYLCKNYGLEALVSKEVAIELHEKYTCSEADEYIMIMKMIYYNRAIEPEEPCLKHLAF